VLAAESVSSSGVFEAYVLRDRWYTGETVLGRKRDPFKWVENDLGEAKVL
jgi:hypothetical protein